MTLPRLSQRQKAGLAVALAFLLWAPSGISAHEHTIITGHSTFYDGDTYDPCLASIAGLIRNRVMWFNDQVLVETYGGRGTFVYLSEEGAADPKSYNGLYSDGTFYDFIDPNGAHWHVEELYYTPETVNGAVTTDPLATAPNQWVQPDKLNVEENRTYYWVVELAAKPIFDDFAGATDGYMDHTYYNFLLLADTCKMNDWRSQHDRQGENDPHYNITHTGADLSKARGHPEDDKDPSHNHEAHMANLWFGTRPVVIQRGQDAAKVAGWESDWAIGWGEQETGQDVPDAPEAAAPTEE